MSDSLTERERLRAQRQSGGQVEVHPERLGLTELASFLLTVNEVTPEQTEWLARAARRVLGRSGGLPLPPGKVAAVLDNSYSSSGSRAKRARPLALAYAAEALLREARPSGGFRAFWTHPPAPGQRPQARGQSNLTERLLDALDWGAATVLVVSDAVENDPPGAFHAALTAAKRLQPSLVALHFNPVFDAEALQVRALSALAPATGLRDADDLPTALGFARSVAGEGDLRDLELYLKRRAAQFIARAAGAFAESFPEDASHA